MSVYYDGGLYQYWFGGGKSYDSYGVAGMKIKNIINIIGNSEEITSATVDIIRTSIR